MNISTVGVQNDLHVAAIHDGKVVHRMRGMNGAWSPWGALVPPKGHEFEEVSCACVGNALHLVVRDTNGIYFHDIRRTDGSWQGMAQLPDQPLVNG